MHLFPQLLAFAAVLSHTIAPAAAVTCESSSSAQTAALIELYTSEGCNSCPPADKWFSHFSKNQGANVVPLSFHVDYWDYIGWKDRFASPRFGERQRALAQSRGGRTVYTPQVFINGRDIGQWRDANAVNAALASVSLQPAAAHLTLQLGAADGKTWTTKLTGSIKHPSPSQQIWIAVYQDNLSSEVKAGENSGVHLQHDRVVRQWLGPFQADTNGQINLTQRVGNIASLDYSASGVVAIVEDSRQGSILQAISQPFCQAVPARN